MKFMCRGLDKQEGVGYGSVLEVDGVGGGGVGGGVGGVGGGGGGGGGGGCWDEALRAWYVSFFTILM